MQKKEKPNSTTNIISKEDAIDDFEKWALKHKDPYGNTFFIINDDGCVRMNMKFYGSIDKVKEQYKLSRK